jgi:hypothetical protein
VRTVNVAASRGALISGRNIAAAEDRVPAVARPAAARTLDADEAFSSSDVSKFCETLFRSCAAESVSDPAGVNCVEEVAAEAVLVEAPVAIVALTDAGFATAAVGWAAAALERSHCSAVDAPLARVCTDTTLPSPDFHASATSAETLTPAKFPT